MVVVAAGAQERGLRAERAISGEAEHVAVEGDRLGIAATLRWTWPMVVPAGRPSNGSARGSLELAEQAVDVERQRRHARGDLALPDSRGRSQ